MTGQKKTGDKPPSKLTTYEISRVGTGVLEGQTTGLMAWIPVGEIATNGGARTAIRTWADASDDFTGGELRAVPKSNITTVPVTVETKRQLTLGTA